uniref:Uncharacterized protein n=1 Tax=Sinocyclocheilus rhinocerous TaxID=307959 RepID=A0A673I8V1_9TELE
TVELTEGGAMVEEGLMTPGGRPTALEQVVEEPEVETESQGTGALSGTILGMKALSGTYSGTGALSGLNLGTEVLSGPILGTEALSGLNLGTEALSGPNSGTEALSGQPLGTEALSGPDMGTEAPSWLSTGTESLSGLDGETEALFWLRALSGLDGEIGALSGFDSRSVALPGPDMGIAAHCGFDPAGGGDIPDRRRGPRDQSPLPLLSSLFNSRPKQPSSFPIKCTEILRETKLIGMKKRLGYVCNLGSLNRERDAATAVAMGTPSV